MMLKPQHHLRSYDCVYLCGFYDSIEAVRDSGNLSAK